MVYRTIIRIKVMYSTASPPPKKEGAKSITPSESKGGKPPTVWQRLSVFYQIIPVGATSEQKSGRISCRFLRREAPLRRGYFKSVPQAHRNSSLFSIHSSLAPASQGKTTDAVWRGSGRGSAHDGCHGKNRPRKGVPGRHNLQSDGCGARAHCVRNGNSPGGTR